MVFFYTNVFLDDLSGDFLRAIVYANTIKNKGACHAFFCRFFVGLMSIETRLMLPVVNDDTPLVMECFSWYVN